MLQRKDNTIFCPDCGRSWHFMDAAGLEVGGRCPSDDCPSNADSPLGAVAAASRAYEDDPRVGAVGAVNALQVMQAYWAALLKDGEPAQFILDDMDELQAILADMRAKVNRALTGGDKSVEKPIQYLVRLYESDSAQKPITLTYAAIDAAHALEQAKQRYPSGTVLTTQPLLYVIFSPRKAKDSGKGYWSTAEGWVALDAASFFTEEDTNILDLPIKESLWMLRSEIED